MNGQYQKPCITLGFILFQAQVKGTPELAQLSTSNLVWRSWTRNDDILSKAVISGTDSTGRHTFVCRCFFDAQWTSGKLIQDDPQCMVNWSGASSCTSGEILMYEDCQALDCPNDLPSKCEHDCPNH